MWKNYPEYNRTVEEWVMAIDHSKDRAHNMRCLQRALKRAVSDRLITKAEQKSLWNMIVSPDNEDHYVALKALETKYNLTKTETNG